MSLLELQGAYKKPRNQSPETSPRGDFDFDYELENESVIEDNLLACTSS
jgi:hypothetical protein